jgi:hypothetical protein
MKRYSAVALATLMLLTVFASAAIGADNDTNVTENQNGTTNDIVIGNATEQIYPVYNQIDPSVDSRSITAGNRDSFTVSFTNSGNETLTLTPKVVTTPDSVNNINESWITISPTNATVAPGSVQKFNIEENVPSDAEGGDYQGIIAFTDDLVPNSTQYVNSMQLGISVQSKPKIELQTSSLSDALIAGKEYEYKIKIKNVAAKDITLDPTLCNNYWGNVQAFGNDAIEISAPSILKAGEVTNMTMRVHVPENATGTYNGYIDMGIDGKVNDGSTPQISMYFTIDEEPTVPFVKTFNTRTTDPITIEVSYYAFGPMGLRVSPKLEEPDVELGLTHNSSSVNMTLVKSVESGYLATNSYPIWAIENGNIYQESSNGYVETYKVLGAIGNWKLTILPKNVSSLTYSVTVGDNNSTK